MMLELLIYGGCLCACLQSFLPHNTHHRHTQNNTQTQSGEGEYNFTLNRFNILNVAESVRFATFARRQTTLLPKTQHTHTHTKGANKPDKKKQHLRIHNEQRTCQHVYTFARLGGGGQHSYGVGTPSCNLLYGTRSHFRLK